MWMWSSPERLLQQLPYELLGRALHLLLALPYHVAERVLVHEGEHEEALLRGAEEMVGQRQNVVAAPDEFQHLHLGGLFELSIIYYKGSSSCSSSSEFSYL